MVVFKAESWLVSKYWDVSVGYLTGVPLPTFPSYRPEYPWDILKPQRCLIPGPSDGALPHTASEGTQGCTPARSASSPSPRHNLRRTLSHGLCAASRCLLVKYACFPHPLQPPPQNPAFCRLHFVIISMLMNSWQISDSYFHNFTFTDGNILAYLKKKEIGGGHFLKIWHQNVMHFV